MRFSIAAFAALAATAVQGATILPRIDGCPPGAPWPMANPGQIYYHICCVYNIRWGQCCDRDSPIPLFLDDKRIRACTPDFIGTNDLLAEDAAKLSVGGL
ncbi:hypothetical protein GQ44DRAFT_829797 [Phaeosphaeriaceae sp. PMI808]|nr:hypothetical protein GQ44DRAFT_829797 [Phaeosphaeriaceae sp. PMI808]